MQTETALLVPKIGLEPIRCCHQRFLRPPCMPIPPLRDMKLGVKPELTLLYRFHRGLRAVLQLFCDTLLLQLRQMRLSRKVNYPHLKGGLVVPQDSNLFPLDGLLGTVLSVLPSTMGFHRCCGRHSVGENWVMRDTVPITLHCECL